MAFFIPLLIGAGIALYAKKKVDKKLEPVKEAVKPWVKPAVDWVKETTSEVKSEINLMCEDQKVWKQNKLRAQHGLPPLPYPSGREDL